MHSSRIHWSSQQSSLAEEREDHRALCSANDLLTSSKSSSSSSLVRTFSDTANAAGPALPKRHGLCHMGGSPLTNTPTGGIFDFTLQWQHSSLTTVPQKHFCLKATPGSGGPASKTDRLRNAYRPRASCRASCAAACCSPAPPISKPFSFSRGICTRSRAICSCCQIHFRS